MVDLSQAVGFSVQLDPDTLTLRFGEGIISFGSEEIHFDDLAPMLLNAESNGPDLITRIYPEVLQNTDRELLATKRLRFEFTVMASGSLGDEEIKTRGHYHSLVPETNLSYPKVIEVIQGRCFFLLQKAEPPYEKLEDAVLIMANARERVVIPPGYGHLEINPTEGPVVLMSCVSSEMLPVRGPYLQRKGACYYATRAEKTTLLVPNEAYPNIPTLRVGSAHELPDFAKTGEGLYLSMIHEPWRLDVLSHPERYHELFAEALDSAHIMRGLLL
ncbi:MAG TPA: glucose-6-phosphate isomerase family protein [Chroococcales cyanobacterium]|jgi:glucose-6-phosphate isomerase